VPGAEMKQFCVNWEGSIILENLLYKNTYSSTAKENENFIKTSHIKKSLPCPSKSKRNVF
jgi:hypothetical protein